VSATAGAQSARGAAIVDKATLVGT